MSFSQGTVGGGGGGVNRCVRDRQVHVWFLFPCLAPYGLGRALTPGLASCPHILILCPHGAIRAPVFFVCVCVLGEQGPPLADNLRRLLENRPMKGFKPQKAFLGLVSTGDENAVLSWRSFASESKSLWTFKDYIDRKWMRKYKVRGTCFVNKK